MKQRVLAAMTLACGASLVPGCVAPPCPAPSAVVPGAPDAPRDVAKTTAPIPSAEPTASAPPVEVKPPVDPASCADVPTVAQRDPEMTAYQSGGKMEPVLIQATVRALFPQLRKCYERGLWADPELSGRIAVRFVIGEDGRAREAQTTWNTLPNCEVVRCVRDAIAGLTFPRPDKGVVTVIYPVELTPDRPRP